MNFSIMIRHMRSVVTIGLSSDTVDTVSVECGMRSNKYI